MKSVKTERLIKRLQDLSWKLACTMEYAKNQTSKGSYAYGNLETLENDLTNKIRSIQKDMEDAEL